MINFNKIPDSSFNSGAMKSHRHDGSFIVGLRGDRTEIKITNTETKEDVLNFIATTVNIDSTYKHYDNQRVLEFYEEPHPRPIDWSKFFIKESRTKVDKSNNFCLRCKLAPDHFQQKSNTRAANKQIDDRVNLMIPRIYLSLPETKTAVRKQQTRYQPYRLTKTIRNLTMDSRRDVKLMERRDRYHVNKELRRSDEIHEERERKRAALKEELTKEANAKQEEQKAKDLAGLREKGLTVTEDGWILIREPFCLLYNNLTVVGGAQSKALYASVDY